MCILWLRPAAPALPCGHVPSLKGFFLADFLHIIVHIETQKSKS